MILNSVAPLIDVRCQQCNQHLLFCEVSNDETTVMLCNVIIKCSRCRRSKKIKKITEKYALEKHHCGILKI